MKGVWQIDNKQISKILSIVDEAYENTQFEESKVKPEPESEASKEPDVTSSENNVPEEPEAKSENSSGDAEKVEPAVETNEEKAPAPEDDSGPNTGDEEKTADKVNGDSLIETPDLVSSLPRLETEIPNTEENTGNIPQPVSKNEQEGAVDCSESYVRGMGLAEEDIYVDMSGKFEGSDTDNKCSDIYETVSWDNEYIDMAAVIKDTAHAINDTAKEVHVHQMLNEDASADVGKQQDATVSVPMCTPNVRAGEVTDKIVYILLSSPE